MAKLNEKHAALLQYVTDQINNGVPPTVREICQQFGIKSTSTAHKYLKELAEEGLIQMGDGQNRSIRLVRTDRTVSVPLLGTVAAGQPILAVEQIEGYVPFQVYRGDSQDLFALRVKGSSMIDAAILDGDVIVARKTPAATNGEIVVALVEDEATVKTFYKEKGHFRLQPENDTMEPILVNEVIILGKVVAVIRNYE